MDNIIDFPKFKKIQEWMTFSQELYSRINYLMEELKKKDEEISQLKGMLDAVVPSIKGTPSNVVLIDQGKISQEELICLQQIEKFKDLSDSKVFDKDDTAAFEAVVRTYDRIQHLKRKDDDKPQAPKDVAELMLIAASSSEESNG